MKTILKIPFLVLALFCLNSVKAQNENKVIIITLDGLRWQELFGGADSLLINDERFVENKSELKEKFWKANKKERRETLFPFFWDYIAQNGVMLGNRWDGNKVNLVNKMVFSYPGYNEILTGIADDEHINSNDKINNPNKTILEIANNTSKLNGKVLAFGSWDVFPYIINEERSGVPVNSGYRPSLADNPTEKELFLNKIQEETPKRWGGVRFDVFTHNYALEALKSQNPDLMFIAYGETDDFAHDGRYDQYLESARRTDQMIKQVWDYVNSDPYYKGKTSILITTDHGRGTGVDENNTWRGHGSSIPNADQTWIMAFGKNIKAVGEQKSNNQYYTTQFAPSIAKILNLPMNSGTNPLPILK